LEKFSKKFQYHKKEKRKPCLKVYRKQKSQKNKIKIKIKINQIRSDQEQLKNFEKEQEIQLMMNNTYNKKTQVSKRKIKSPQPYFCYNKNLK
jgi:hypothetical protein